MKEYMFNKFKIGDYVHINASWKQAIIIEYDSIGYFTVICDGQKQYYDKNSLSVLVDFSIGDTVRVLLDDTLTTGFGKIYQNNIETIDKVKVELLSGNIISSTRDNMRKVVPESIS